MTFYTEYLWFNTKKRQEFVRITDDVAKIVQKSGVKEGMDDAAAVAAATTALDTVDLLDVADRKIGGYSKGMRQRVKLAQAIAHDPDLLILDEPLSGMATRAPSRFSSDIGRLYS